MLIFKWTIKKINSRKFSYIPVKIISVRLHTPSEESICARYVRLGDHDLTDKGDATKADTFQVDYYIQHQK